MTYLARSHAAPALAPMGGILDTLSTLVGIGASAIGPKYTNVGGACKPTNSSTLELFKEIQRQCNRVAKIKGFPMIGVDGDIGPGTVTAMQAVQKAAKADLVAGKLPNTYAATAIALIGTSTCAGIAAKAVSAAANVKTYADQIGVAPSVASPKPATPPAVYDLNTGTAIPQGTAASAVDAWKRLGTGAQLATIGVAGLAAVMLLPKKKRKK